MSDSTSYEISFLLSPLVPAEGLLEEVEKAVLAPVKSAGGTLVGALPALKMITLAYPVARRQGQTRAVYKDAYFGACRFSVSSDSLAGLDAAWRNTESLLRFLLVADLPVAKPVRQSAKPAGDKTVVPTEDLEKKLDRVLDNVSQ